MWRAAPLSQWTAGASVAANWGGPTYPVFKQSARLAAATVFAVDSGRLHFFDRIPETP